MDFKDGFTWAIIGFFVWLIGSIAMPILKWIGIVKLNWWLCLLSLGILLLFLLVIFYGMCLIDKDLEKEYGNEWQD